MMGKRHLSQRRKWLCYHFLPKAKGDVATRLDVDKADTVKQLKVKYGDNPRKFGLIQSQPQKQPIMNSNTVQARTCKKLITIKILCTCTIQLIMIITTILNSVTNVCLSNVTVSQEQEMEQ